MTNQAELQIPYHETNVAHAGYDPALDPTLHFSVDCLQLIGASEASALMHARNVVAASDYEELKPKISELNLQTSAVGQFYQTRPHLVNLGNEFISLIEKRAALISKHEDRVDEAKLAKITHRLNNLYHAHKNNFDPISPDIILQELSQMITEVTRQHPLADRIEGLFNDYSTAGSEIRDDLIRQIGDLLHSSTELDGELIGSIFMHSQTELVMGKFAHFEARGLDIQDIENRMNEEGFLPQPVDRLHDANPDLKFRSPTQVVEQCNLIVNVGKKSDQADARMAPLYRKFNEIQAGRRIQDACLMATAAARALASAEYNVDRRLYNDEVEINLDEFPFTMAKRDAEGRIDPNEYAALMVLTKELMLRQPRQEIADFLKTVPLGVSIDFESTLTAMFEQAGQTPHSRDLADSLEAAQLMITRHLDAVHAEARMVDDVLAGKKPRAKNKNPKPEEVEAAALHGKLHRAGFSTKPEKALVTAIATGKWEQLQNAHSKLRATIEAVAGFSDTFGLDVTRDHPAHKSAGASFEPLLKGIATALRKDRGTIGRVLTAGQLSQLKSALGQAGYDTV